MVFELFCKHVLEPATPAAGSMAAAAAEVPAVAETHCAKEILQLSSLSSAGKQRCDLIRTHACKIGNGTTVMIGEIDVPVGGRQWGGFSTAFTS
jgi:hypothetical protein